MPGINIAQSKEVDTQLRVLTAAGYKLKDLAWYEDKDKVLTRRRRFGDKQSWIIDLPTEGVDCKPSTRWRHRIGSLQD
jgi:hypothetical protein